MALFPIYQKISVVGSVNFENFTLLFICSVQAFKLSVIVIVVVFLFRNRPRISSQFSVDHCWIYRRSWSEMNPKVWMISSCIKAGISKYNLFNILRSKEVVILKLDQFINYYISTIL